MEGHVSLMRAGSPIKRGDVLETSMYSQSSALQLNDSTWSTASFASHEGPTHGFSSFPLDMRRADESGSTMELVGEWPRSPERSSVFQSSGEGTNSPSPTTYEEPSRHSNVFPPRPSTMTRSQSLVDAPLYSRMDAPVPPSLQITRRGSYPRGLRHPIQSARHGQYPPPAVLFPPRPGVSPPLPLLNPLPPLRPTFAQAPPGLSRTAPLPNTTYLNESGSTHDSMMPYPPVRLPPIEQQVIQQQQAQEVQGKKLRRRRRRRKGNTWHGEGLPRTAAPVGSAAVDV